MLMLAQYIRKIVFVLFVLIAMTVPKSMAKTGDGYQNNGKKKSKSVREKEEYYLHKDIMATYFYVGEHEATKFGLLDNRSSAWTEDWIEAYGDIDHPEKRKGYFPEGFIPAENPFYFALPYNDLTANGYKENIRNVIPWVEDHEPDSKLWPYSYCKNRWIRIIYKDRVCCAQWEDVGPYETDDWQYVFGPQKPKNSRGSGAGLDISPACLRYLDMKDNDLVHWQFVDQEDVPDGPWKKVVTTSHPRWD